MITPSDTEILDDLLWRLDGTVRPGDRWTEGEYAVRQYTVPVSGRRRLQGGSTKGNDDTPLGFHDEITLAVVAPSPPFARRVVAYALGRYGGGDIVVDSFAIHADVVHGDLLERMVALIRRHYAEAA